MEILTSMMLFTRMGITFIKIVGTNTAFACPKLVIRKCCPFGYGRNGSDCVKITDYFDIAVWDDYRVIEGAKAREMFRFKPKKMNCSRPYMTVLVSMLGFTDWSDNWHLKSGKLPLIKTGKRKETYRLKNETEVTVEMTEDDYTKKIAELKNVKNNFEVINSEFLELRDTSEMPVIALGTALLDKRLIKHVVEAAIDMGYRAVDTAYIYGNEKEIGEAINNKINDGTVKREDLYIISKLWSTYHRKDLVEKACRQSLDIMGLKYYDLYLVHTPMSLLEGSDPLPKIANVLQYSEHDYMDAWRGIEDLIVKGLVRRGGVSNFNSEQVHRVMEKGRIKPVVNQVECHPYLCQERLGGFCDAYGMRLSCYGVLGSKGTPTEHRSDLPPVIDDPLVLVMAAGLGVSPGQMLIAYQLHNSQSVVIKASSARHLYDNLKAQLITLEPSDLTALKSLNKNKRTYYLKGLGETHKNYPFNIAF